MYSHTPCFFFQALSLIPFDGLVIPCQSAARVHSVGVPYFGLSLLFGAAWLVSICYCRQITERVLDKAFDWLSYADQYHFRVDKERDRARIALLQRKEPVDTTWLLSQLPSLSHQQIETLCAILGAHYWNSMQFRFELAKWIGEERLTNKQLHNVRDIIDEWNKSESAINPTA